MADMGFSKELGVALLGVLSMIFRPLRFCKHPHAFKGGSSNDLLELCWLSVQGPGRFCIFCSRSRVIVSMLWMRTHDLRAGLESFCDWVQICGAGRMALPPAPWRFWNLSSL